MESAAEDTASWFDQCICNLENCTTWLGFDITLIRGNILTSRGKYLQATNHIEQHGDKANVGVATEGNTLILDRRIANGTGQ
jgi:hypothetical protein